MVKRLIYGILLLLLALFLLEKVYDFLFLQNENLKATYVQRNRIDADAVAVGSSNVLYMFDPDVFREESGLTAYNLGTNHASLSESLALLHLYLKNNKPPKYVLLGLSLPDIRLSGSGFHSYAFAPYLEDTLLRSLVRKEDETYQRFLHIPFFKYAYYNEYCNPVAAQGLYKLLSGRAAYYKNGYYTVPDDPRGFSGYEAFKRNNPNGVVWTLGAEDRYYLEELLKYAAGKGVKVIGYEPPFWQDAKPYFKDREGSVASLRKLFRTYGSEYLVFDSLYFCSQKKYFVSAFHTGPEGTKLFTRELARSVRD